MRLSPDVNDADQFGFAAVLHHLVAVDTDNDNRDEAAGKTRRADYIINRCHVCVSKGERERVRTPQPPIGLRALGQAPVRASSALVSAI